MRSIGDSAQAKNNNQRCGKKLWLTKNFEKRQTLHKPIIRIVFQVIFTRKKQKKKEKKWKAKRVQKGTFKRDSCCKMANGRTSLYMNTFLNFVDEDDKKYSFTSVIVTA